MQEAVRTRNAKLDAIETDIGVSPILKLFTGAVPTNCAAADPAGSVVTMTLPSDWMNAASGGVKTLKGTWSGNAAAAGTIQSYRIYDSGLTFCGLQGTASASGGGGEMIITSSATIAIGQPVSVASYAITAGNA